MTTTTHPMFEIGEQARDEERMDDAERAFRAVLADEPEHFGALYNLGKILWDRRDADAAIPLLEEAARQAPEEPELELTLARVLHQLGRYDAAEELCRRLLAHAPDQADAHVLLGRLYARRGAYNEAGESWGEALRHQPGHPRASVELATLLLGIRQPGKARRVVETAREHHPDLPMLKVQHAAALAETEDHDQALELLEDIPETAPAHVSALAQRAEIHLSLGQPEAALTVAQSAPEATAPALRLAEARAWAELDEPGEAANRLRDILEQEPDHHGAWDLFSQVSPEAISNRDMARLKRIRRNGDEGTRVRFGFALARVARARENRKGEMNVLENANARQSRRIPWPREQFDGFHQALRQGLTADWLERNRDTGAMDFQPVFLVGLPFSGTRLVEVLLREQGETVLGESGLLRSVLNGVLRTTGYQDIPDLLADPPDQLTGLFAQGARQWLAERAGLDGGVFVERSWNSFQFLPLLYAAFPGARFIRVRRSARDLAVANYRHRFEQGHGYSYNLDDTVYMAGAYDELLEHWRALGIPVTGVDLDSLVHEPADTLAEAGLPLETDPGDRGRRSLRAWGRTLDLANEYERWLPELDEARSRYGVGDKV